MTALDTKLLPCPFCGNDGFGPIEDALQIHHNEPDYVHDFSHTWSVQCDKCTATMGYSDSEEEAIDAWNRRVSPSQGEGPAADVVEARDGTEYLLDDAGRPVEIGGGDVLALVENIPADPVLAYAAGWNDCRSALDHGNAK